MVSPSFRNVLPFRVVLRIVHVAVGCPKKEVTGIFEWLSSGPSLSKGHCTIICSHPRNWLMYAEENPSMAVDVMHLLKM